MGHQCVHDEIAAQPMAMIEIKGILEKFDKQGEKTGWTYLRIPSVKARAISPIRTIYRVRGFLDDYEINQVAILPMGEGDFILPVNGAMRKAIGKSKGAGVLMRLQFDPRPVKADSDFMECLDEFPKAKAQFQSLATSHKNYFAKWLSGAKTQETKANRIAMAIDALSRGLKFNEMLREKKAKSSG